MIRLFETGELEIRAEDSQGSETVNWEEGDIAVISGALRLNLSGNGKLACICVNYEIPSKPTV